MRQKKKKVKPSAQDALTRVEARITAAQNLQAPAQSDLDESVYSYYTEATDMNESRTMDASASGYEMVSPDKKEKEHSRQNSTRGDVQIMADLETNQNGQHASEEKKTKTDTELIVKSNHSAEIPVKGEAKVPAAKPQTAAPVKEEKPAPVKVVDNKTAVVEEPKKIEETKMQAQETAPVVEPVKPVIVSKQNTVNKLIEEAKMEPQVSKKVPEKTPVVEEKKQSTTPSLIDRTLTAKINLPTKAPAAKTESKPTPTEAAKVDDSKAEEDDMQQKLMIGGAVAVGVAVLAGVYMLFRRN